MQKVVYYEGNDFGTKSFVKPAVIVEEKKGFVLKVRENRDLIKKIEIKNPKEFDIVSIDGVGDVIKMKQSKNKMLYLGAYKGVCLFNFFVRLDEGKTVHLAEQIVYKFKNKLKWFKNKKGDNDAK